MCSMLSAVSCGWTDAQRVGERALAQHGGCCPAGLLVQLTGAGILLCR
jgi:hypothetical protein